MNTIAQAITSHDASALRDIAERLSREKEKTARWLRLLAEMFESHKQSEPAQET